MLPLVLPSCSAMGNLIRCGGKPKELQGDKAEEGAIVAKTGGKERGHGYTVEEFVNYSLVPAYGYACWKPLETKKQKDLEQQMKQVHKAMQHDPKADFKVSKISDDKGKKLELPFQAICHVRLTKAVPDGNATQSFDFNQEARLQVKVLGKLCFPPDEEPKDDAPKDKKKNATESWFDRRWFLEIRVHVVLERAHEETDDGDDEQAAEVGATKLKVRVEDMVVQRSLEDVDTWVGDPMVDSWLPVGDIKQDIEVLLQNKLQSAVSGIEGKHGD